MLTSTLILTIEFATNETQLVADVLALIAAARNGAVPDEHCRVQAGKAIQPRRSEHTTNVTHDDIRDLMAELIETTKTPNRRY